MVWFIPWVPDLFHPAALPDDPDHPGTPHDCGNGVYTMAVWLLAPGVPLGKVIWFSASMFSDVCVFSLNMCYFVPAASTQVCYNVQSLCSRRFGGGLTCSRQCQCVVRGGNWHHDAGTLRAVGSLLEVPQVSGRLCQGTRAIPHQMQVSTMCPSHLDCPLNVFACFCLRTENRARKTHFFEYRYFGAGWGGVGGGGMLTFLVLRTWYIATLLRSLGSFTTLHVATLLIGWGGGGMLTFLVLRTIYILLRCWDLWDCSYVNVATLYRSLRLLLC